MDEPIWVDPRVALALHERLLALHGGPEGVRDEGALQGAFGRPRHLFAYGEQADLFDLAAAYTSGIVRNHPFVDGNKRTAFVIGVLFLELNGFRFEADEADAANAVIELAAGTLADADYAAFLRETSAADG